MSDIQINHTDRYLELPEFDKAKIDSIIRQLKGLTFQDARSLLSIVRRELENTMIVNN